MSKSQRRSAVLGQGDRARPRAPEDNGEYPIRWVELKIPLCDPPDHWSPGSKVEVWNLTLDQRRVLSQLRQALFQERATVARSEEFKEAPQPVVAGRGAYGNIFKWLLDAIAKSDDA